MSATQLFQLADAFRTGKLAGTQCDAIASAFGPYTNPPAFSANVLYSADQLQSAIDDARARSDTVAASYGSAFGASDVKVDVAALAALEERATGVRGSRAANRVLTALRVRRLGLAEYTAAVEHCTKLVPSRQKRQLVSNRKPAS